jgi:hypothetical protein
LIFEATAIADLVLLAALRLVVGAARLGVLEPTYKLKLSSIDRILYAYCIQKCGNHKSSLARRSRLLAGSPADRVNPAALCNQMYYKIPFAAADWGQTRASRSHLTVSGFPITPKAQPGTSNDARSILHLLPATRRT